MFGDRTALNVVTGGDPAEQLAHGRRLPNDEGCFRTGELMYAVRELLTGKPVSGGAAPAREGHGRDRPAPKPSLRGAGRRIRRGSRADGHGLKVQAARRGIRGCGPAGRGAHPSAAPRPRRRSGPCPPW
ncbi:hypothetical protein [Streptomyces sp. NBC_01280]|uniref:hypothetical protein n=1 Tax=Streptomyces sp. NBC_01280 TaxID=2903810 RepID=UPI003FCC3320